MTRDTFHPSARRTVSLAFAFLSLTACAGEAGPAVWTATVETLSNGAMHVVNVPPDDGLRPTWRLEEELRIGAVDAEGPYTFGQVKGLAVTSEGRIAVLDAQAQELRIFDEDGSHLATFGGRGAGPGEMEEANGLMIGPGDRLWVPDVRNARISVFDPEGGFVRSHPMPVLRYGFIWDGMITDEGRVWKPSITLEEPRRPLIRVYGEAEAGEAELEFRGVALEREFALLDSLLLQEPPDVDPEDPPGSFFWQAPGGMPRGYIQVPFYPQGQVAYDPRGVIWQSKGGDPSYRIKRWTPGGDTTLVLETHRSSVRVTAAEREAAIASIRATLEEQGVSPNLDWSKIPDVKPPVQSMFLADDGRLWVRTASPDSLRRWDVYERDGRWAAHAVTALSTWEPVSPVVRNDRFWAVVVDELGVPYVVRARLVPSTDEGA